MDGRGGEGAGVGLGYVEFKQGGFGPACPNGKVRPCWRRCATAQAAGVQQGVGQQCRAGNGRRPWGTVDWL